MVSNIRLLEHLLYSESLGCQFSLCSLTF